jgi:hypothetical protein
MVHDKLWQPMPNTHDSTLKLEVLTFGVASINAPSSTTYLKHGFFNFFNFAQKHCLISYCALDS